LRPKKQENYAVYVANTQQSFAAGTAIRFWGMLIPWSQESAKPSNWQRWNGSHGSTINACILPSDSSRLPF